MGNLETRKKIINFVWRLIEQQQKWRLIDVSKTHTARERKERWGEEIFPHFYLKLNDSMKKSWSEFFVIYEESVGFLMLRFLGNSGDNFDKKVLFGKAFNDLFAPM